MTFGAADTFACSRGLTIPTCFLGQADVYLRCAALHGEFLQLAFLFFRHSQLVIFIQRIPIMLVPKGCLPPTFAEILFVPWLWPMRKASLFVPASRPMCEMLLNINLLVLLLCVMLFYILYKPAMLNQLFVCLCHIIL